MSHSESKELTKAKKLIDEGNHNEALQLMKNFEENEEHALDDIVASHLLNCEVLRQQGLYEDLFKFANQTYKESLKFDKNLQSVDALFYMAEALLRLFRLDKAFDRIIQGEELLKTLTHVIATEYKQREAYIAFLKGWFYYYNGETDRALEYLNNSITMQEELGVKQDVAQTRSLIAWILGFNKGELDTAIKYGNEALNIAKECNKKYYVAITLNAVGVLHYLKGELDQTIILQGQSLKIFRELNNKSHIAILLNNMGDAYRMKGELDHALECLEQSLALCYELGLLKQAANCHDFIIQILVEKGDIERAQQYLQDMEQLINQLKDDDITNLLYHKYNLTYLLNKALILKKSSRAINRGKAEEILKQLLDEASDYVFTTRVLINLSELLITELHLTHDLEVLDEIKPLITELLDLSEKSHSFWVLGEAYLLQAKLMLISLNVEEARRLLSQGQKIADKYGLNQLAIKISSEHDELLKQIEMWENLKESKAPLAERMELSRLNEQMEGMVKRRVGKLPKLEAEQPVLLNIMTKEGNILLSNPFTADLTIDSAYFSEFLSSCNTFCDQILSESFDRVKFGQHTVLITAVDSFSICYMFQGQSYSARQKLIHFSEAVKKEPDIMKILQEACNKNVEIKVNELDSLEELIFESFLSDPEQFQMPFKAYKGDGTFVFVSYSHTDRLKVYPIIDYLNKTGTNIWYDEGIPVSEDWKSSIVDNLERCNAFLVFITPHIIDSEYVRKEISFALKKQKPFFSIYLKETQLPSKLEFEIGDIQFIKKYLIPESEFYIKLNRMLDPVLNK